MAKIRPLEIISTMSGKVCMHSKMYFRTNPMNSTVTTGKLCYPSTSEPTADQQAAKDRFGIVSKAVRERIAAMTDAEKKALKSAARAAQAGSTFGYAFHKWNDEYDAEGNLISADPEVGE